MIDLNRLLADPERAVADIRASEIPGLLVSLSGLLTALAAREAHPATDSDRKAQPNRDENLSAEEASRRLGMSKDWLYRNASSLPFTVRIGRRVLFSARGLERWNHQRQGR